MRTLARLSLALPLTVAACAAGTPPSTPPESTAAPIAVAGGDPAEVAAPATDARPESSQWLGVAGESAAMMPGTHETFLGVWVDVPSRSVGHAPLATSVVVDTSGSMAGDKIVHARASAKRFIDGLKDGDIASLVSFDDTAREIVPPTELGAASRVRFAGAVSELRADGATNLFEGIRLGGLHVMGAPASHAVRRIVLVSDGIATAGPTSRQILGALADKAADRGVQVTAVGVGLDYDEATLNDVAMRSSGRLYHVGNTAQLASMLEEEMKLLRGTRAANAFVDVMPAAGVTLSGVDGTRTQMREGGGLRIPIGALFAGQRREFLVRARIDAPSAGSHPIASVRLHFSDPSEGNLERVQEAVARYEVTNDAAKFATLKDERVQGIWSLAEASKATQRAAEQIDGDRFDDAERDLAAVEKKLEAQAAASKDAKTKARIQENARMVGQARASASKAAAAPAPARPAAKRAAKLEANDAYMDSAGY